MGNAIKYGLAIGFISGFWIMLMHELGFYHLNPQALADITWTEYLSVGIPFGGLYFGLKNYRKQLRNKMSLFQAMMQGFKILIVGSVLYMATLSIYLEYTDSRMQKLDYMQRLAAMGVVGILLVLVVSLLLMTRPRNL